MTSNPWTLRDDLELFGVKLPAGIPFDDWAAQLRALPCTNSFVAMLASAILFYRMEKGHNPKVNDIYDALIYTSTCMSVGYADVFARTPGGKIIGTLLMTLGPSLTAKALDGRQKAADATQQEIRDTLQEILGELRARNAEHESSRDPGTP
jgi:hypothetical protein